MESPKGSLLVLLSLVRHPSLNLVYYIDPTDIPFMRRQVSTISSSIFYSILPGTMFISGATLVILSTIIYARDDQNIKARQKAE